MKLAKRLWILGQLIVLGTLTSPATRADQAPSPGEAANTSAEGPASSGSNTAAKSRQPPRVAILCITVQDKEALGGKASTRATNDEPASGAKTCDGTKMSASTLIGTGDVTLLVSGADYANMLSYEQDSGQHVSLLIDGVDLRGDAVLVAVERLPQDQVSLRFNVKPGDNSRKLWAALYRSGRMTEAHDLNAALGYGGDPISQSGAGLLSNTIAITDKVSYGLSLAMIAVLIAFGWWIGVRGDALRDCKTPQWYFEAYRVWKQRDRTAALARLGFEASNRETYEAAAEAALIQPPTADAEIKAAMLGLSTRAAKWSIPKASFSLARVQLAVWFLFAVGAGVFLWIVYGELPDLDNSLLALLGISVAVTGMSFAIDDNIPKHGFVKSQGFLRDLTTDFEDTPQVHRFQALVVNVLLLVVGIVHVGHDLEYPIFEPSWLLFLGISGVALAGGKQLNETKPATQVTK